MKFEARGCLRSFKNLHKITDGLFLGLNNSVFALHLLPYVCNLLLSIIVPDLGRILIYLCTIFHFQCQRVGDLTSIQPTSLRMKPDY
jgi:hypothetical protein